MSEPTGYQSYLLRLWRDNARPVWQASLQSTATEQVYYFADVDQMWVFLRAQLGINVNDPAASDTPSGESERGASG